MYDTPLTPNQLRFSSTAATNTSNICCAKCYRSHSHSMQTPTKQLFPAQKLTKRKKRKQGSMACRKGSDGACEALHDQLNNKLQPK